MSNEVRTRNRLPYDFVDGLLIKGVDVSKWTKVARGTSDTRPILGVEDYGVMFMDNTLSPNGKPIWWNGYTWVDYTGTIV